MDVWLYEVTIESDYKTIFAVTNYDEAALS